MSLSRELRLQFLGLLAGAVLDGRHQWDRDLPVPAALLCPAGPGLASLGGRCVPGIAEDKITPRDTYTSPEQITKTGWGRLSLGGLVGRRQQ